MTIKKRTQTFYYCTECDYEYPEEAKEEGRVCLKCENHPRKEGCEDCMFRCDEESEKTISGISGCGKSYCEKCIRGTWFDSWYPGLICKNCLDKYPNIKKFYGSDGDVLYKEAEQCDKPFDKYYVVPEISND